MCRLVFRVLLGILYISFCFSSKSEKLMENVVVLRVQNIDGSKVPVDISCGDAYEGQSVTWKKNGVPIPELQGNRIQVMVQEWGGGNYTCHRETEETPLNYTVLMVRLEPDNRTVILEELGHNHGYIHCSTANYRGSFHCSWRRSEIRSDAGVLLVKGHRNQETVPCKLDSSGSEMRCTDHNCPYKEEQHRISLTVYMYSESRLEAYTKNFYLRDIVAPERPTNLHLYDKSTFRWDYPDSWEKPCSYFSLLFQVKVVRNGGSCDSHEIILSDHVSDTEYKVLGIQAKKYVFCVRAQDKHTGGPWGHWSQCQRTVTRDIVSCTCF